MSPDTYDPTLSDGVVVATDPAAGSAADPSEITLKVNESSGTIDCGTRTDYPYVSTTTPTSGMIVKGFVQCRSYSGPVVLTTYLYACTADPAGTTYGVLPIQSNCTEYAGDPTTVTVTTPYDWAGFSFAATGSGRDASKWYIGVTVADIALPSVSQVIEPS